MSEAERKSLGKDADALNEARRQAAVRFYEHCYLSGMSPIGAINWERASVSSDTRPVGMPATEVALIHRRKYRDAVEALKRAGEQFLTVVELVVTTENGIEEIAVPVSGYRDRGKAIAVTMDRLRVALEMLRVHFRMGRLDAMRTTMAPLRHESELRQEGGGEEPASGAMRRPRSLAGM